MCLYVYVCTYLNFYFILYAFACLCMHEWRCPWIPGARPTGSCEPRAMGPGNWTRSSGRAASTANHWANSPALLWLFFLMKLHTPSSDDGSYFPTSTPPILWTLFQISQGETKSVLHGLICYCFLLETKTRAYLENGVSIHKDHPALGQIGNGATKSESLCTLRQLKCKNRGWRDGSEENQLLVQRIWGWFPAPTWGFEDLYWSVSRYQTHGWCINPQEHTHKILLWENYIRKNRARNWAFLLVYKSVEKASVPMVRTLFSCPWLPSMVLTYEAHISHLWGTHSSRALHIHSLTELLGSQHGHSASDSQFLHPQKC